MSGPKKLEDLHPAWTSSYGPPRREGTGLKFDCPCGCPDPVYVSCTPLDGGAPAQGCGPVWDRTGADFATLTLSPSIRRVGGCNWHGWLRNGELISC